MNGFDLNLLPLLIDLCKTQNMSQTAKKLGKTTSAISKSVQKLREELDDELFTRTASGLKATPYTEALVKQLISIQKDLNSAISGQRFKPETYRGSITIVANSVLLSCYQQPLYQAIKKQAPQAQVIFQHWQENSYQRLIDGEVDLALHFFNESCSKAVYQRIIDQCQVVLLARKKLPVDSLKEALAYPLAIHQVQGWNSDYVNFSRLLSKQGIQHNIVLKSEDLSFILQQLATDNLICPLPDLLINKQLKAIPLPEYENKLDIVSCVASTHRHQALQKWLASLIKQISIS
ncbi:MAG: DNA-binding transcriptional LysR family regulator [Oceanospirillaceae bacterium]|jgi:DNA-binding transcriptional LysR family regulator